MAPETFGSYLKSLRLAKGMGLRTFAEKLRMQPSNLSDIEHGKKPPPRDPVRLAQIAEMLQIERDSEAWSKLHDLSIADSPDRIPPDLVQYAEKNNEIVPLLLRATARRKLSRDELMRLIDTIKKHF